MRVLVLMPSPLMETGYGIQGGYAAPILQARGHEGAIAAITGLVGEPLDCHGITVYPSLRQRDPTFGMRMCGYYAAQHKADVMLSLSGAYLLDPRLVRALPCSMAQWTPIDACALSESDAA